MHKASGSGGLLSRSLCAQRFRTEMDRELDRRERRLTDCVVVLGWVSLRMEYIGPRRKRLVNGNQSQLIAISCTTVRSRFPSFPYSPRECHVTSGLVLVCLVSSRLDKTRQDKTRQARTARLGGGGGARVAHPFSLPQLLHRS